jgi:hypothetical protein
MDSVFTRACIHLFFFVCLVVCGDVGGCFVLRVWWDAVFTCVSLDELSGGERSDQ